MYRAGGGDAITEERAGQSEVRLRITDDFRLRVFTKEPRIFTAYKAYVPLKCDEKEFWSRYYRCVCASPCPCTLPAVTRMCCRRLMSGVTHPPMQLA